MLDGKILFTTQDDICFLKLVGSITCTTISGFDAFVDNLSKDEMLKEVFIDLCSTAYIDSTNLGLIAEIAGIMRKKGKPSPTILSTNEKVNSTIESMGFDKVFTIIKNQEKSVEELREIPEIEYDDEKKAHMILKAHKNIVELNEKNGALFKDVIEIFEDQLKKKDEDN